MISVYPSKIGKMTDYLTGTPPKYAYYNFSAKLDDKTCI